jgi:uncharacterized protein YlxW (UPF0749 family)
MGRNKFKKELEDQIDHYEKLKQIEEDRYNKQIEDLEDQLEIVNTITSDNQIVQEGIITSIQDSLFLRRTILEDVQS